MAQVSSADPMLSVAWHLREATCNAVLAHHHVDLHDALCFAAVHCVPVVYITGHTKQAVLAQILAILWDVQSLS